MYHFQANCDKILEILAQVEPKYVFFKTNTQAKIDGQEADSERVDRRIYGNG